MGDGYCEVDFDESSDDAEPLEFCDAKIVTARKPHICDECGGAITKGETYKRTAYRYDGKFDCERQCDPCREAAGEFNHRLVGAMLWPMFYEEWDNGAHISACISRLSSARAKEHMRAQWLKWQALRAEQRRKALERRKAVASREE